MDQHYWLSWLIAATSVISLLYFGFHSTAQKEDNQMFDLGFRPTLGGSMVVVVVNALDEIGKIPPRCLLTSIKNKAQ